VFRYYTQHKWGSRGAERHWRNQFWDAVGYNWICVNDSDQAIGYGGGFACSADKMHIADALQVKDVAMATIFGCQWAITLVVL